MEQHPIPRQITTFEFKLIGFMTLRQFLYLVVFLPLAYIVFIVFPVPILNFILGFTVAGFGFALAFLPINERPLDAWIKDFLKRLTSPTQYVFEKQKDPIYFLDDTALAVDYKKTQAHVESRKKLSDYLSKVEAKKEERIEAAQNSTPLKINNSAAEKEEEVLPQPVAAPETTIGNEPFLAGVVRNRKETPLPNILVYIKDQNTPVRLLKTNPHGVFATYNALPSKEYEIELKDPKGLSFFDTMKVRVADENLKPLEFYSRELL